MVKGEGKEKYLAPGNELCPFCGQPLPENMEQRMAELFDENYEQEIASMKQYFQAFREEMNRIYLALQNILRLPAPEGAAGELPENMKELRQVISENLSVMKEKEAFPDREYELRDITPLLEQIIRDTAVLNRRIRKHNQVMDSQKAYQKSANQNAWDYLAYLMKEDIERYRSAVARNEEREEELTDRRRAAASEQEEILARIREQEELTENTREAMQEINEILRSSRYQGFTLREKEGEENLYEIVYSDGRIAESLSEGEYRMLTFLYFCQRALKRTASSGSGRQKILVMDDPTAGLDQRGKKVVLSMIRRLAGACLNDGTVSAEDRESEIEQIFLMTHDLDFYRQLMDSYEPDAAPSEEIGWFQLRKRSEKTTIQRRGE